MPPIFPWDWPGQLAEAYQAMVQYLQQVLAFSMTFDNVGIVQWLYGNALGLAPFLAGLVVIVVLPLGLVLKRMRLSAAMALIVALAMPFIGVAWFMALNIIQHIGDDLSRLSISIANAPAQDPLDDLFIPMPGALGLNAVISCLMFAGLLWWSGILLFLFFNYEIYNVVFTIIGLLLVAMYGFGPRTRKLFSILGALAVVTMLAGRPVALGIIEIGNAIATLFPGPDNIFFVGLINGACMMAGIVFQVLIFWGSYKGINEVIGRFLEGNIRGTVDAYMRGERRTPLTSTGTPVAGTQRAQRLVSTGQRYGSAVAYEVRKASTEAASKAMLAKGIMVASKAHPVAAAVVTGATIATKAVGSMQQRPVQQKPKKGALDGYR
jgi:hypothetical protein